MLRETIQDSLLVFSHFLLEQKKNMLVLIKKRFTNNLTYLVNHGDKDFVIGLRIVIEWILVASEFHLHLYSLFLGVRLFVNILSVLRGHRYRIFI